MGKDKKQIMINGVDVSGCENYRPKDRFTCYPYICNCHQKPDCHYKQLARKTQELETICKAFDIEYGYDEETGAIVGRCNKLIEKEKQFEEYQQLKQECEKLEKKLRELELENTTLQNRNQQLDGSMTEVNRCLKALEEIEKIVSGNYEILDPLAKQQISSIVNKAKGEGNEDT